MQQADFMNGLAKGLAVIEAFDGANPKLSISDVARITGLDRATTRRCLLTLHALGYAEYDGKFFNLMPRVLRLGHSYLSAMPLPLLVQPFLDQLSELTGESASASVLDGVDIVYVARASQKRVMSINLNPGSRLPAYCSSMGRVLLAALSDTEAMAVLDATEIRAHTAHSKVDKQDLMDELRLVREQGYAIIDQELEIGLRSIAVPIRTAGGKTIAALNIGAQAARAPIGTLRKVYLPALLDAQRAAGKLLS
jgi:IclR family pca regulon transcriptional regulator